VKDQTNASSFDDHTALCVGRLALDLTCTIPMASMTTTLGYTAGVQIEAKVSATNAISTTLFIAGYGWSLRKLKRKL